MRNDVFEDTAILCQRVNKQVGEVFSSPEMVMAKLIQNIFENKLQVGYWAINTHFTMNTHLTCSLIIYNVTFDTWLSSPMLRISWMEPGIQM